MRQLQLLIIFAAASSVVLAPGLAQAGTGTLTGVVTGPGGVGLPGALVTVRSLTDSTSNNLVSGEGGEFRLAGLQPASYEIDTRLPGFVADQQAAVQVTAETTTRIELVMSSATFQDTVEVRATHRHDSLEAEELRSSGARDLGEALEQMPGVWKVRKGAIGNDVVLRGYRQDDITMLIDGARVAGACPNRMDPPAFHLDFAEIDRVDVATTGSKLAVQGAMGGMVNVVTRRPEPGFHAAATMTGGSWGMRNPSFTASYRGQQTAYAVGGSQRSAGPYRDGGGQLLTDVANYRDGVADEDAYDIATAWGRFAFEAGQGHSLELAYSHQEADDLLYPGLLMDAASDDTNRIVLSYRWQPEHGATLRSLAANAYLTGVDHWMVDSLRTSATGAPRGWSMGTMATTRIVGTLVQADIAGIQLGIDAYRRSWNAWTEMAGMGYLRQHSIPDVETEVIGLSAHWAHALGERTRLELGGRLDRVESTADAALANTALTTAYHGSAARRWSASDPSWSVRLSHDLESRLRLGLGLASTVRAPDARELFFGLRRRNADWVGNPELAAPRSTGADLTASWSFASAALSVSAWYDQVDDFIYVYGQPRLQMVPGVMGSQARTYGNVDAELWGGSLELTAALSSRVYLAGNIAYVRGTKTAEPGLGLVGTDLAEMPPLSARLALRWASSRLYGEIEGTAAARQDQIDHDLGEQPTPAWSVINLRGGISRGAWRLQVVIENLLDRSYREHFSSLRDPYRSGFLVNEPGRNLSLMVGWQR